MARKHVPIDIALPSGLSDHSTLTIRTAKATQAAAVLERAHRWRNNVGWLPRGAIVTNLERGWVWEALIDNQPAGHVMLSGGLRSPYTLRHNCIEEDLWNRGLGSTLTRVYLAYARLTSAHTIARVRTRADIAAQTAINIRLGAVAAAVDPPRKTTRHSVVTWHRKTRHAGAVKVITDRVDLESLIEAAHDLGLA